MAISKVVSLSPCVLEVRWEGKGLCCLPQVNPSKVVEKSGGPHICSWQERRSVFFSE
jgi:hypothetical protein